MIDPAPLPRELQELLEHERRGLRPADLAKDRVWAQVVIRCLPAPPLGHAPSSPARALASRATKVFAHRLTGALITFGLGGAMGALVHAGLSSHVAPSAAQQPPAPVVQPPPSPPAPAVAPVAPTAVGPAPAPKRAPAAKMQHAQHRPTTHPEASLPAEPVERDTSLAAERSVLDSARAALWKGDGQGALEMLDRYTKDFGAGVLAEEEAALRVQTLAKLGRLKEADDQATQFHERFPKSLLWPAVQSAVESPP